MLILPWELSIGSPWLERETQICECPVPVPTGQSLVPRKEEGRGQVVDFVGLKELSFLPENFILPNFQRKQDDKGYPDERGRKEEGARGFIIQ
jgi:hypothetical protein